MIKKTVKHIYDFGCDMSRNNIPAFASSVAFFYFLSLFPTLIFAFSLIPFLPITEADMVGLITDIVPEAVDGAVASVINEIYRSSAGRITVSIIITLWSSGAGMLGLIRGLNGILHIEDKRNYFVLRIVAIFYTLILLAVIVILVALGVFGEPLVKQILEIIPTNKYVIRFMLDIRGILIWAVLTIFLTLIYAYLPAKKQKFFYQMPGAVIVAASWSGFTKLFSIYIDDFNGMSAYGSLTTVIAFMFWMYALFYILMFGAYFNRYYYPYFREWYKQHLRYKQISSGKLDNLNNK